MNNNLDGNRKDLKELLDSIRIEKAVPIPQEQKRRNVPSWSEVLEKMEVQDSFVAPEIKRSSINSTAKKLGIVLTIRIIDSPPHSIRVWRVR